AILSLHLDAPLPGSVVGLESVRAKTLFPPTRDRQGNAVPTAPAHILIAKPAHVQLGGEVSWGEDPGVKIHLISWTGQKGLVPALPKLPGKSGGNQFELAFNLAHFMVNAHG